jgi:hypothetical protein
MNNVVFMDVNTSSFTAKNNIEITNADFRPNSTGNMDLKVRGNLTVCGLTSKGGGGVIKDESVIKNVKDAVLFPNPNNGSFSIFLREKEVKDLSVNVFDVFGKLVYETKVNQNEFELNIPNLPTGIYLVKLNSNSINETLKFIKE